MINGRVNFKSIRNFFKVFIIAITLLFFFISPTFAQGTEKVSGLDNNYTIDKFDSNINVTSKGLSIKENIVVNFTARSHGIFRYLPQIYEYNSPDGKSSSVSRLVVTVKNIVDEFGQKINYTTYDEKTSIFDKPDPLLGLFYDFKVIKMGDPDILVVGRHQYTIEYTVENLPSNLDVFSYGLVGSGWSTPINNFTATLNFEKQPSSITCKYGLTGEPGIDSCTLTTISPTVYKVSRDLVEYKYNVQLNIKGVSFTHAVSDTTLFLQIYWYILVTPFLIIALFLYWITTQKPPKGTGVVVPQFNIPEDLTPAEIGTLYDDSVDKVDISATFIDLATRGIIKIRNLSTDSKSPEFELVLQKYDQTLRNYEETLITEIFGGSESILVSELSSGSMATAYKKIQSQIYLWGVRKGYFNKKPDRINSLTYAIIFGVVCGVPAIVLNALSIPVAVAMGIIGFLCSFPFFYFRNYKTEKGVLEKEKILGLKLFIEYAKKDQLEMLETPLTKQELFEKILPYAMVFNLHTAWAKVFKDMNISSPDWYEGSPSTGFLDTIYFVTYMNLLTTSFNEVFSIPVSETGVGFVGGMVGDAIGGGFSGGGGGRW